MADETTAQPGNPNEGAPPPDTTGSGGGAVPPAGTGSPPAAAAPLADATSKEGDGGAGGGSPPPAQGQGAGDGAPADADWKERRVAKLTGRNKELAEKAAALEERLRQFEAAAPSGAPQVETPPAGEARYTQADVDRAAEARAQQIATVNAFNAKCEAVRQAGEAQFKDDFGKRIATLSQVADHTNPREATAYAGMLQAAFDAGDAPTLLHHLGGHPLEAEKLIAMTPVQQAVAMTKLAAKLSAPKTEITAAPPPISPTGGNGGAASRVLPGQAGAEKLSSKEWHARRNEQLLAQRKRA